MSMLNIHKRIGKLEIVTKQYITKQVHNITENNSPNIPFLEFYADTGCDYRDNEMLYPLAYRTHSHNLGKILE